jgi:hypothetical protein
MSEVLVSSGNIHKLEKLRTTSSMHVFINTALPLWSKRELTAPCVNLAHVIVVVGA